MSEYPNSTSLARTSFTSLGAHAHDGGLHHGLDDLHKIAKLLDVLPMVDRPYVEARKVVGVRFQPVVRLVAVQLIRRDVFVIWTWGWTPALSS